MGFAPPKDGSYGFQDYPRWKMAALALKFVGKWGAAAQGVAMVSRRSWRRDAVGQAGFLEVGCFWCGCEILEAGCNQSFSGPAAGAQSVGLGVLAAGSSQSM